MLNGLLNAESKVVFYKNSFQRENSKIEENLICKCKVHEVLSDSEVVVKDDDNDKIEFQKHVCYIVDFYTANKVYRCSAYYVSDYSEDGYQYFTIEVVSPLQKMQRRNHQRYPWHTIFSYSVLQEAQVHDIINKGWDEVKENLLADPRFVEESLVDISGGGLRFTSKNVLNTGDFLLCLLKMENYGGKEPFPVLGEVVYTGNLSNDRDKSDIRLKYIGITEKQREEIIRFVFWLERQRI